MLEIKSMNNRVLLLHSVVAYIQFYVESPLNIDSLCDPKFNYDHLQVEQPINKQC